MSTETRNRILTIIFLLLITLLASELSYYFFNHRSPVSTNQPASPLSTPSPKPTTAPTQTPNLKTDSSPNPSISPDLLRQRSDNLIQPMIQQPSYFTKFLVHFTIEGKVTKVTDHSLTLIQPHASDTLTLVFSSHSLQVITISSPNGIIANLTNIPLHHRAKIDISRDMFQGESLDPNYSRATAIHITVLP